MVVVILAHPYLDRSRANRALASVAEAMDGVSVRSLYDRYPDFSIDVDAERETIGAASTLVFQHPLYWYAAPALLKLWFEKVLTAGYAYGTGGDALHGKRCLWVVTTGGDAASYSPSGMHNEVFEAFVPVMRQTARFCGMRWEMPFVVHGAHRIDQAAMDEAVERYRATLLALVGRDDRA